MFNYVPALCKHIPALLSFEFYVDINKNTQVLDTAPLLFAVGIVIPSFFTLFLFGLSVYFYLATTCWW